MGRLKGEGVALAGLIMGYLSLVAIPFILIIAAIAIPNLLRSRIAANEASALGNIRSINMAAVTYSAEYPKVGYPAVLNHLGGGSAVGAYAAGLIDSELAAGKKTGYVFYYESLDSDSDEIRDQYFVRADPFTANSGKRSFCSDQTGVVRYEVEAQCTAESPPIQ